MKNRSIILAKRPIGNPKTDDFVLQEGELPDIQDNEILVKNFAISLDDSKFAWLFGKQRLLRERLSAAPWHKTIGPSRRLPVQLIWRFYG